MKCLSHGSKGYNKNLTAIGYYYILRSYAVEYQANHPQVTLASHMGTDCSYPGCSDSEPAPCMWPGKATEVFRPLHPHGRSQLPDSDWPSSSRDSQMENFLSLSLSFWHSSKINKPLEKIFWAPGQRIPCFKICWPSYANECKWKLSHEMFFFKRKIFRLLSRRVHQGDR